MSEHQPRLAARVLCSYCTRNMYIHIYVGVLVVDIGMIYLCRHVENTQRTLSGRNSLLILTGKFVCRWVRSCACVFILSVYERVGVIREFWLVLRGDPERVEFCSVADALAENAATLIIRERARLLLLLFPSSNYT